MNKFVFFSAIAVIIVVIAILSYELVKPSYTSNSSSSISQTSKGYLLTHKTGSIASNTVTGNTGAYSFNLSKSSNSTLVDNFTYSNIINFSKNPGTMWKIYDIISSLPTVRISQGISTYIATKNLQLIGGLNNTDLTINAEGHLVSLGIYGKNDIIIFENGILFYPSSMPGIVVEVRNNTYVIK